MSKISSSSNQPCHLLTVFSISEIFGMPNPLTLKQRLAALAVSPPSPTGPELPRSPGGKRRGFFNPSWVKRPQANGQTEERDAQDRIQHVMSRMIYQAGVDFE
jgi:Rho GTPase-activating protein 1